MALFVTCFKLVWLRYQLQQLGVDTRFKPLEEIRPRNQDRRFGLSHRGYNERGIVSRCADRALAFRQWLRQHGTVPAHCVLGGNCNSRDGCGPSHSRLGGTIWHSCRNRDDGKCGRRGAWCCSNVAIPRIRYVCKYLYHGGGFSGHLLDCALAPRAFDIYCKDPSIPHANQLCCIKHVPRSIRLNNSQAVASFPEPVPS